MNTTQNYEKLSIDVKLFVHYPSAFNSTTISDKLKDYFRKYLEYNKFYIIDFNECLPVTINSAPYDEEEMIIINITSSTNVIKTINNESNLSEWKKFITSYLNYVKLVKIKFTDQN